MTIVLSRCVVRSWQRADVSSLVSHANDRDIWLNLRDRFPHPYTRKDGVGFVKLARAMRPEVHFAIDVSGEAVGAIGFLLRDDVDRVSAEVGYWLGRAHWGRGIATEALVGVTRYACDTHGLTRMFATPFAHNLASCRVLEKAGYMLEGRLTRSAIKDGQVLDQLQYAFPGPCQSSTLLDTPSDAGV